MTIPPSFGVHYRNPGHWDISSEGKRIYTIRGENGNVTVQDQRERPYPVRDFPTVSSAMSFICDTLMREDEP